MLELCYNSSKKCNYVKNNYIEVDRVFFNLALPLTVLYTGIQSEKEHTWELLRRKTCDDNFTEGR